jgi:fluoroquinolone resistance protein
MEHTFSTNKTFDRVDFEKHPLRKGEYDTCIFISCDLSNKDLSEMLFIGCEFVHCNLSLATLTRTTLRNIQFKECKMVGLRFDTCNEFGLSFSCEHCVLSHSTFYRTKIRKTTFANSQLDEADFTECDLTGSVFDRCDLKRALFHNTIMEKADFRTSYNYTIDPEVNKIRKARFALPEIVGLLAKYDITIDKAG